MRVRLVHDGDGDDAAAALSAALRAATWRHVGRCRRAMVGHRVRRDLSGGGSGRSDLGTARRPLRPQADPDSREPRHGDLDVAARRRAVGLATGRGALPRGTRRRLRERRHRDDRDADPKAPHRVGARHACIGDDGGQSGRAADRRAAARTDRHLRDLFSRGRADLLLLRHDAALRQGRAARVGCGEGASARRMARRASAHARHRHAVHSARCC